ncbi:MAG: DUF4145 domain-containing protein [Nitrospira sp.]|nr:DUF4145 domain-containing protein [Nitrospira sp.]
MPTLNWISAQLESTDYAGANKRFWRFYRCVRCGVITASARGPDQDILELFPSGITVDLNIPLRAKTFLDQAINSLNSPAGAVMLAASGVDAMLKAKSYREGSLYARIDKAVHDHVITSEMGKWAHEVRLDANDQRHADEDVPLPTSDDARRVIDFVLALGQFMFVLPAKVQKGIADAQQKG